MKKQALLRVTTTSLGGCSLWKLQTSCAMFLSDQGPSMFAASSTEWLEIPPIQRPGQTCWWVCRMSASMCSVVCGIRLCRGNWVQGCSWARDELREVSVVIRDLNSLASDSCELDSQQFSARVVNRVLNDTEVFFVCLSPES